MQLPLLAVLPPDRRARFEPLIDGRLGGLPGQTAQPPRDWTVWSAHPDADRPSCRLTRLAVLWSDRDTSPAVRFWRARNDGLAILALMVSGVLGLDAPSLILATLLTQGLALWRRNG